MKQIKLVIGVIAVLVATNMLAQGNNFGPGGSLPKKQVNSLEESLRRIALQTPTRPVHLTVESLAEEMDGTGSVNACHLAAVAGDKNYLSSLGEEDQSLLSTLFTYVDIYGTGCASALMRETLGALTSAPYDEKDPEFLLNTFRAMSAINMGYNIGMHEEVYRWAVKQVERASMHTSDGREGVWAALVLSNLGSVWDETDPSVYTMSSSERKQFEAKLKEMIAGLDYLKNEKADYFIKGVKGNYKTNQTVLLQLFAQANSWFATKEDNSTLHSFVTTGGLNAIGNGGDPNKRFSDSAESFYLHHPTPGTDGRGHWADTANGRKHHILALLVQGLSLSYATYEGEEGSGLLTQFVKEYIKTDSRLGFTQYLFVPLYAMRDGKEFFFSQSLFGWDNEEKALQEELYAGIKHNYKLIVGMTFAQGASEVYTEWHVIGKVFGLAGKYIFKPIGKGISKTWVKYMPKRARVVLRNVVTAPKKGAYKVAGKNYRVAKHARWAEQRIERDLDVLRKQGLVDIPGAMRQKWLDHGWATKEEVREIVYNYFTERTGIPVIRVGI